MFALLREVMEEKRPQWMPQLVEDEYEDASKAQFWKKQVRNDAMGHLRNSTQPLPSPPFPPLHPFSPPLLSPNIRDALEASSHILAGFP
jgi:hypothetical protein